MSPVLSVIVPLYNEELVIRQMVEALTAVLAGGRIDFEIILVNDGSVDRTLPMAKELCRKDGRLRLISFSRNFGHQIAITAGMDKACGQAVAIIDADLQDPPEVLLQMLEKWREGYHVVYGVRKARKGETAFKLFTAAMFYRILRAMTPVDIPADTGDFRLMDRRVVEQLRQMRERSRFVRGMVSWVGFKQGKIEYIRESRRLGETKYPFKKMLKFAVDGMLSFSQMPLRISSALGLGCALIAFVFMVYGFAVKYFYPETAIQGWASIFVASLFLGGVQLMSIGILGEYIGRMYDEIKGRPLYIIEEEMNFAVSKAMEAPPKRAPRRHFTGARESLQRSESGRE
ncbi:MAG: glycosyltransferase family 2 protein [Candidatus Binatia bacterium]